MRRVVLAVLAVILVNLPWAHDAWIQHRLDASGVPTVATVVAHTHHDGRNFISYRFSRTVDPQQHLYDAVVTDQAYRDAVSTGRLSATVLKGSPSSNRVVGEVTGSQVVVIAAVGDAIIALVLGFSLLRRRRSGRLRVVAVEDDLVTVAVGRLELIARLADDPASRALAPTVGSTLKAVLYLVPEDDIDEGPPLGEVEHLGGSEYRIAGRVRATTPVRTELMLDNGYVVVVASDEVAHLAELRGPAQVTGHLLLAAHALV